MNGRFPGSDAMSDQLLMLNRMLALERVGGDQQLLQEVAQLFLEDCPRAMTDIRTAIDSRDAKLLEREAHSLKGSVANFGAEPVVSAALELERMGRNGDFGRAESGYEQLSRMMKILEPQLAELAAQT